jgi:hypothetical protein
MDREKIVEWFMSVTVCIVLVLAILIAARLAFDLWTAPNIFIKEKVALEQKQVDEMCVAWWFESDLGSAKKRVCGK